MEYSELPKLKVVTGEYGHVEWDGNQFGFFVEDKLIQLTITDEDFENGEIDDEDKEEILSNLEAIKVHLTAMGYSTFTEEQA